MKTKSLKGLLLIGMASLTLGSSAQTGWLLQGNSNATTSDFIGTTNSVSLKFKTKNTTRMVITTTGKVGIGNTAPSARLDVFGLTTSTDPVFSATGKYVGAADVIAVQGNSTPSDTGGIGVQGIGNFIGVDGSSNTIGVSGSGIVGVLGSSFLSGTTGFPTGVFGQTDAGEQGNAIFGISENSSSNNISVWGVATDTATVGGIRDYAGYFQGNVFGYRFFQLSDERMKKNIVPIHNVLDRLMKVKTATYNYKTSEYPKLHLPAGMQTGFLAENLHEQFPDMVVETVLPEKTHPKTGEVICEKAEVKVVNYMGMIPVLTTAIQEQQAQIAAKDAAIADLQKQLTLLENRLSRLEEKSSATGKSGLALSESRLEQNQPNPFSGITTIKFQLPENTTDAIIKITSMDGKLIREVNINGNKSGQLELSAGDMNAGSYLYSLYVNGELSVTKTLMISK